MRRASNGQNRYLIGLEFVHLSPAAQAGVEHMVEACDPEAD